MKENTILLKNIVPNNHIFSAKQYDLNAIKQNNILFKVILFT